MHTGRDENEPQAAQHLIQELIQTFPREKEVIMTFAQQLKEDYKKEFMSTFAQQLKQEGLKREHHKALAIAKSLLKQNVPLSVIKSATGLSEQELVIEKA